MVTLPLSGEWIIYSGVYSKVKRVRSSPHKVNHLSGMGRQLLLCRITDLIKHVKVGSRLSNPINLQLKKRLNRIHSLKLKG